MLLSQIVSRLYAYGLLIRINKPIGTFLLLWPTLWALWVAGKGYPNIKIVILFVVGGFLMRSAGCAINDFADRHIDGHVARTQFRPLVIGQLTSYEALIVFSVFCLLAFYVVLFLNKLTIMLSLVGLFFAVLYPFTKRITYLPQLFLGAAFGWAIPMSFAAQLNTIPSIAWLMYLMGILWPFIYDTIYAMVDREDDRRIGVKSTAILFNDYDYAFIALLFFVLWMLLLLLGFYLSFHICFYLCLAFAMILIAIQLRFIKTREPMACFKAFKQNNWLGFVIFLGFFLNYYCHL